MNTIGTLFRFTDFGESHGTAVGGVIDGMPSGFKIDFDELRNEMARRRPGSSPLTTSRNEPDEVVFLSGVLDGITLGTPIAFYIANTNTRSADYDVLEHTFRPNHADYTYYAKYGVRDHRGGGRASARETAARVAAGAIARQYLKSRGIVISARAVNIGGIAIVTSDDYQRAEKAIAAARSDRDTLGGIVECIVSGVPVGLGEPVFGKLQAMLAAAMMSINAAKGFEYGDGFAAASSTGSCQTDEFRIVDGTVRTATNHSGGIQGGISNGEDIIFRVAFKPVATLPRPLATVTDTGEETTVEVGGRHDICVVPRAVPVVEAMAALVLLDACLIAGKH